MGEVPPLMGIALNKTEVPWQNGFVFVAMVKLAGNAVLTIMLNGDEVTGLPLTHPALEVNLQVTTSPFAGIWLYAGAFVPTLVPLTFHWYIGDMPPLTAVAE